MKKLSDMTIRGLVRALYLFLISLLIVYYLRVIRHWDKGRVVEWFMALVLKTSEDASPPWVQIPPLPL